MTESRGSGGWWTAADARRYVGTFGFDQAANAAFYVLVPWVASHELSETRAISVIAAAAALKLVVLILVGGAVGDRFGYATVTRWTLLARAALLVGLSAVLISPSYVALLAVALLYGAIDGAHEPAMESLSTVVVAEDRQRGVQGVLTSTREVCLLVAGPAAGALVVLTSSTTTAIVIACLLVLARALLPPRAKDQAELDGELPSAGLWRDSIEGWKSAFTLPGVTLKLAVFALANLALTPPVIAGIPLLVKDHGWSAAEFGLIDGGYAAGALIGGLVVAKWGDDLTNATAWAIASLLPTALIVSVYGWVDYWWLLGALNVIAGYSTGFGPSLLGGAIKEATPKPLQARVQAARLASIVAGAPLGYVIFAALSQATSVAVAIAIMCVVLAVTSLGCLATSIGRTKEKLPA